MVLLKILKWKCTYCTFTEYKSCLQHLASGSLFDTGKLVNQGMQIYAYIHMHSQTHANTHSSLYTAQAAARRQAIYILPSCVRFSTINHFYATVRCAELTSAQPGWCRAVSSLWGKQISEFTSEPSVRDDAGCILQLSAEASEEAEENYNCQISTQTNKQTCKLAERDDSECVYVCLCLSTSVSSCSGRIVVVERANRVWHPICMPAEILT